MIRPRFLRARRRGRRRAQAMIEFGLVLIIFVPFVVIVGALLLSLYQSSAVTQGTTWLGTRITQTGTACADGTTSCNWVDGLRKEMAQFGIAFGSGDTVAVSVTDPTTGVINYYDQTNPSDVPTTSSGDIVWVHLVEPVTSGILVGSNLEQYVEDLPGSTVSWLGVAQLDYKGTATTGIPLVSNFGLGYTANVEADAPRAYWRLSETGGTAFAENSGDPAMRGTIGPTVGTGVPALIVGGLDTAFHLDGSAGSWLSVPDSSALDFGPGSAWSFELWVNRDRDGYVASGCAASQETLFARADASLVISRAAGCGGDPGARDVLSLKLGSDLQFSVTPAISAGAPHHIVVTYDGTHLGAGYVEVHIYLDGQDATLRNGSYDTVSSGGNHFASASVADWGGLTGPLTIGADNQTSSTDHLAGYLDELALYDRPLTPDIAKLHYVAGIKSSSPVIVAAGRPVYFQDLTNGSPLSWNWAFPETDGTPGTSGDQNPEYVFRTAGSKNITLTVHTMAGDATKTLTGLVDVVAAPGLTAAFGFDYAGLVEAGNPAAYWRLGEGGGTAMVDTVGHDNGTYSGAGGWGQGLLASDSNGALYLGASPYTITAPDAAALHLPSFSIAMRIQRNRSGVAEDLFGAQNLTIGINADGYLQMRFAGGTATSAVLMVPGRPYDIVATYAVGEVHLFVNSVDNTATSGAIPAGYSLAGPISLGAGGTSAQFQGILDEVAIYPGTLGLYNVLSLEAAAAQSPMTTSTSVPIAFTSRSTGSPTIYQWDFGDGATSSTASPTHTYAAAGTYTVRLTVSDGSDWSSVVSADPVTIVAQP